MYSDAGISWYYVLDTANKRFKLPRTKFGFTGYRTGVGNYVKQGLPDHNHTVPHSGFPYAGGTYGGLTTGNTAYITTSNASASNSVYGATSHVQPPATEMKLYFYVGIPSI